MTLSISDHLMESTETQHAAVKNGNTWTVTWWTGTTLNTREAELAMKLAELIDRGRDGLAGNFSAHRWRFIKAAADELGIPALRAVHLIEGSKEEIMSERIPRPDPGPPSDPPQGPGAR